MANPTWPVSPFPQVPLAGTLNLQDQDGRLLFQPDVGDALRRRRYSGVARAFSFTIQLTAAQIATLDAFYTTTLGGGVADFDWTDVTLGVTRSFSFASPYKIGAQRAADLWQVQISLMRKAQ